MILSLRVFLLVLQVFQLLLHRWTVVQIQTALKHRIRNVDRLSVHSRYLNSSQCYHQIPIHVLIISAWNYNVPEEFVPFRPPVLQKTWLLNVLFGSWKRCTSQWFNVWILLEIVLVVEGRNDYWLHHLVVLYKPSNLV